MNLIKSDNYFLLFLQLFQGDIQRIKDDKWFILNPFRKDTNLEIIHNEKLDWDNLVISVGSGLIDLDASIEIGIDSSRGPRSQGVLPVDSSLTYQPVKNFKLTFDSTPSFTAIFPMHQEDPEFFFNNPESYHYYSNFLSTFTTVIPDLIYSNITADLDIPVDLDKDINVPLLDIPLDSSMSSSLIENFNKESVEENLSRVWNFDNIPLGLLFLDIFDEMDNTLYSLYSPSIEGGLFPGEHIGGETPALKLTPLALGLSISNCIYNDYYSLAVLQCKEFLVFQNYTSNPGLPSSFSRVWSNQDVKTFQRDLTENLLFVLLLIDSLQEIDKPNTDPLFQNLLEAILGIINLALTLSPKDVNLTLEGYGEEGITIYKYSLTNSFLLTFVISKLLSSYYDEELHRRAMELEISSREAFLNTLNYKDSEDINNPYFFFAAYLFSKLSHNTVFEQSLSLFISTLSIPLPENSQEKVLYHYLHHHHNDTFPEIDYSELAPSLFAESNNLDQADLYVSCMISLLEKEMTLETNLYPLKETNVEVRKRLRHLTALQSFPIKEHWYSQEEVDTSITEIVTAFNKPLSAFDVFLAEGSSNDLRGNGLTNSANLMSLNRKILEPDDRLTEKLKLLENNKSTEKSILKWLEDYKKIFKDVKEVEVKFNNLPDGFYRTERLSSLNVALGYSPRKRYIYVGDYELIDLYKEALQNEKEIGTPGVYAFYKNRNVIEFKSWKEMCGFIKIEINKGYSNELYDFLKGNIPAGIDLIVSNNEDLSYGNF